MTLLGMVSVDYRLFINRDLPLFERGCGSKVLFLSRREARTWARGRRSDGRLHPYHCRYCDGWHLGHRHGGAGHVRQAMAS